MKEQSEVELIGGIYRRIYAQRIRLDERINSDALSFAAEAFYFRVHAAADDYGIFPATPRICKAETSPLRNCSVTDVAGWLDELEAVGLIRRFDVGAERFGSIGEFLAMQPAGRNGKRVHAERSSSAAKSACVYGWRAAPLRSSDVGSSSTMRPK